PPSLEKRLPLALALMMLVLLVSQYLFKPAPGSKLAKPATDSTAAKVTQKPAVAASTPSRETIPVTAGQVQASSEISTEVDTDLYHIVLSNRGAVVKSWVLKKYKDDAGKPLQVINTTGVDLPLPFSIEVTGAKAAFDPNKVLYRTQPAADGEGVDYE